MQVLVYLIYLFQYKLKLNISHMLLWPKQNFIMNVYLFFLCNQYFALLRKYLENYSEIFFPSKTKIQLFL